MVKRSKIVYILGSIIIGIISIVLVLTGLIMSGVIDTRSYKLVFSSASKSAVYNGEVLVCEEWELVEGELKEGHEAVVTMTAKQKSIGTVANSYSVMIKDKNNADVTSDYQIVCETGTLTIAPAPITIESASASKEYDGLPLTSEEVEVSEGGVAPGQEIVYTFLGEQTEAGESDNEFSVIIKDESGDDVTANYAITTVFGELEIYPRPVTIKTETVTSVYDGKPLTGDTADCTVVSEKKFLEGHTPTVTLGGSRTDVGESKNSVSEVIVVDEKNKDVTHNYIINYIEGSLIVKPRQVIFRSEGKDKTYDGTPLTHEEYVIQGAGLAEDHEEEVHFDQDGQTEIGSCENTIVCVFIFAGAEDVTANYKIAYDFGKLIVRAPDAQVENDQPSDPGDLDKPTGDLTGGDDEAAANNTTVLAKITSSVDAPSIYLRQMSMGDYSDAQTPYAWAYQTNAYSQLLDGTYSMNYLPSVALAATGKSAATLDIEIQNKSCYILPYYLRKESGAYETQTSDVMFTGTTTEYSVPYYVYDYLQDGAISTSLLGDYTDEESAYYRFVKTNYLQLPISTKAAMQQIILAQGWKASRPNIIGLVVEYVRNAATYDLNYADKLNGDGVSLNEVDDPIVEFLNTFQVGVCRHYASAATAIFRALNIPARYTVGFRADNVKAGEETDVMAKQAHAWTEVYVQGLGWVCVDATGGDGSGGNGSGGNNGNGGAGGEEGDDTGTGDGSGTGEGSGGKKIELRITAKSHYLKDTDPNAVLNATNEYESKNATLDALFANGLADYCTVTVTGSQTGVGISEAVLQTVTFWDNADTPNDTSDDVNVTETVEETYAIKKQNGKLHIYYYEMKVTTEGATKTYDATPLTNDKYTVDGLQTGHQETVIMTGTRTDAGVSYNSCNVKIADEENNDVTHYYRITTTLGKLEVYKLQITICAGSAEQVGEGEVLMIAPDAFTVKGDNQILDHNVTATVTGSLKYIGETETTVVPGSVKITDGEGKNVTHNYSIKYTNGKLVIYPEE